MNDLLQAALDSQALLSTFILVFLRVGGTMLILPAFGEASVPRRVRLGLAVGFAMVVAPAVSQSGLVPVSMPGGTDALAPGLPVAFGADGPMGGRAVLLPLSPGTFLPLVLGETLIGLVLGFAIRLSAMALSIAGTMIGQATSLAQAFGAPDTEPVPGAAHFLVAGGLALATVTGLHVDMARALVSSYDAFPLGAHLPADRSLYWALGHAGSTMSLAFSLALPFFAASVAYNIALGVVNRTMPQLMLSLVGAPALSLGVLALMMVAVPAGLSHWARETEALLSDPLAPAEDAP